LFCWRTALPGAYYSVGSADKMVGRTDKIVGTRQSRAPTPAVHHPCALVPLVDLNWLKYDPLCIKIGGYGTALINKADADAIFTD